MEEFPGEDIKEPVVKLGRVKTVRSPDEITFKMLCVHGQLRFTFWADEIVEIQVIPLDLLQVFDHSWFMADYEFDFPEPQLEETETHYLLKTQAIQVAITKKDSAIAVSYFNGQVLQADDPDQPTYWETGKNVVYAQKLIPEGGHIYGFGEKAGNLDKRGLSLEMWNTDNSQYETQSDPLYQSHPFFLFISDDVLYGFLLVNHGRSFFDVGAKQPGTLKYWATNGLMDYILIAGITPADIISKYTSIVGKPALLPRWALGYHQCRWSYMSAEEVLAVASEFRNRHLPCDSVWLDIDYMDKFQDFTWNKKRFKKPTDLMQNLHGQGFKTVAILDPGISEKGGNFAYKSGEKADSFCKDKKGNNFIAPVWPGKCVFPDFAREEVRTWWADLHREVLAPGMLDGTWIDMNEPAHFKAAENDARAKSTFDMFHTLQGHKMPHEEVHNVYGFLMAQAEQLAYSKYRPLERPFILTRAGFAGVQRYAAVWTGDNHSTWEHLKLSVAMLLGMGISGIAMAGADIGGFSGKCTPELFARWIQLGAFYPFCRNHCSKHAPNHEPWVFGDEVTEIARKYLYLRYQLIPYLYDALVRAHRAGYPIMRALCLDYPMDLKAHSNDCEFMLGDFLLVAPVLDEGVKVWDLYLPVGDWVDFWTDEIIPGGVSISRPAPLDTLPLYVQKGGIIPMGAIREFISRAPDDALTLHIYPGPHTNFTHFEDDGWSKDYEAGKVNEFQFEQELCGNELSVVVTPTTTEYTKNPWTLGFVIHLLSAEPQDVQFNGQSVLGKWDAKKKTLTVIWDGPRAESVTLRVIT